MKKVALVDQFGSWAGRGVVVITGGEPFLKTPEVMAISRRARSYGLSVAVNTNGTCIPETLFDDLLIAGPHYLVLSLDAPDAATHDWIRALLTYPWAKSSTEGPPKKSAHLATVGRCSFHTKTTQRPDALRNNVSFGARCRARNLGRPSI
jgi:hypothetical protein